MSDPLPKGAVLQTGHAGEKAEAIRRSQDRRNLLTAVVVALLFHLLIVLGFLLSDLLGVRDLSDWSGPVLVKIGAPDAPESPKPDPGPLPDQPETPQPETPELPETPAVPPEETPQADSAPSTPDTSPDAPGPTVPAEDGSGGSGEDVESPFAEPQAAVSSVPARVAGEEDGNNYEINFEGTDDDVGRAGAYGLISSYMPLPEYLDEDLIQGAVEYLKMSPEMIREELQQYWEPSFGDYLKKKGSAGTVRLEDRPYYWGILVNALGYDTTNPEWKTPGMRSVTVEFVVSPSQGSRGAALSDFSMITLSNNPAVDEAVVYGLSRWVYYNDTGHPVRGSITYNFED